MLSGKVVLITGASKGIGKAIAELFALNGATLFLNARTEGSLEDFASKLTEKYQVGVYPQYFDVADVDAIKQVFQLIFKQTKKLDILVNNAGVLEASLIGMVSQSQVNAMFQTNAIAPVYLSQYAARLMARNQGGSIINMSSIMGRFGHEGQSVYASTKAALIGLTMSLAKELAPQNIRVNAIAPGFVETDMARSAPEEKFEELLDAIKMGRIGSPEEVAQVALFLASGMSSYVTGQVIGVDGGMQV